MKVFVATSFSGGIFAPGLTGSFAMSSMGAIGALRALTRVHELDVIPCHVGQVAR